VIGFAWLDVDAKAFTKVADFIAEVERAHTHIPPDVSRRFRLLAYYVQAASNPAEAARPLRDFVAAFDWPQPYLDAVTGQTASWGGRWSEAERFYKRAAAGFGELNLRYDANAARIALGFIYAEREHESLEHFATELITRTDALRNTVHRARARVLLGQARPDGLPHLVHALRLYEGLGWERETAHLALEVYQVCAETGCPPAALNQHQARAQRLTAALTSDDLYLRYEQMRDRLP
jgi:hypothetical protein